MIHREVVVVPIYHMQTYRGLEVGGWSSSLGIGRGAKKPSL